jgi:hypothetical protein
MDPCFSEWKSQAPRFNGSIQTGTLRTRAVSIKPYLARSSKNVSFTFGNRDVDMNKVEIDTSEEKSINFTFGNRGVDLNKLEYITNKEYISILPLETGTWI